MGRTFLTAGLALPRAGQPMPTFTLTASDGTTMRLWDFKQRRPVLLAYLHGSACASCRNWLAALAAEWPRFAEQGTAAVLIAPEPVERLRSLQAELRLPFPLLSDPDGTVATAYVLGEPGAGERGVALYAADRYLQCLARWFADDADTLPPLEAPLIAIRDAELEDSCGCALPAWPVE